MGEADRKFCTRCYADLRQAIDSRCARCGTAFDPGKPSTYLPRPFPPRRRVIAHAVLTVVLATVVSFVVALVLGSAQMKYMNSGH
jgi:hypothetical protein